MLGVARQLVRCSSVFVSELFTSIKKYKLALNDIGPEGTGVSKVSSVKIFIPNEKLPVSVE